MLQILKFLIISGVILRYACLVDAEENKDATESGMDTQNEDEADETTTEEAVTQSTTMSSFKKGGISRRVLDPRDYALIYENLVPPEFRSTDKRWPGHIDIFQQYLRMPPEEKKEHEMHWKIFV